MRKKKHWSAILKPGEWKCGDAVYFSSNGHLHAIGEQDLLQLERHGLVVWSDHPAVQYRLICREWRERRRQAASKAAFDKQNSRPKKKDVTGVVVPQPGKKGTSND